MRVINIGILQPETLLFPKTYWIFKLTVAATSNLIDQICTLFELKHHVYNKNRKGLNSSF